jgi:hypothetical protein
LYIYESYDPFKLPFSEKKSFSIVGFGEVLQTTPLDFILVNEVIVPPDCACSELILICSNGLDINRQVLNLDLGSSKCHLDYLTH